MDENIQTSKFKVGDVVRLRSGGPAMAVEYVSVQGIPEYRYLVSWFAETVLHRADFCEAVLSGEYKTVLVCPACNQSLGQVIQDSVADVMNTNLHSKSQSA